MAIRYPLVLNGSQIQELQVGDSIDAASTRADNLTGGVVGSIPYQSDVSTTAMLSPSTAGRVLVTNGSGAAPSWEDPNALNSGTSNNANFLRVDGSVYRSATVDSPDIGTPNTIPCRNSSGDLNARQFNGTATAALFADLAEKYLADQDYDPGTVVMVGGEAEVTACTLGARAFGAVSANPAFKMNDGLVGGTYIALKGRVPVKVLGPVKKGDRLISAGDGVAGVSSAVLKNMPIRAGSFPDTFAIALQTNDDPGVKLVESIIL
jgi:hypothetical protein